MASRGFAPKPTSTWDGSQDQESIISGRLYSDYATEPKDRCSVTGHVMYLEEAPAMFKSNMERTVSLSTTEAETHAGVTCVQDML